jgi:uncharacterized protein (DUF2225 family)
MKFLKADYLGEDNNDNNDDDPLLKQIKEKEQKLKREMDKIRKLDA